MADSGRQGGKDSSPWSDLWTDGLVCAFEFVRGGGAHGVVSPANLSRNNSSQSVMDPRRAPVAKISYASSQGKLLDDF
ncbi:hypothetical protein E2562_008126 [Oryza meyeriana var. granulata]|uniref:Uncharacterized protein n=1 Tax=Oryza meyeriana var. granulata TaxID=110450 RepID=A0A6G1CFK3_9ORYZ|nr:hypothetical protein E2562_008126 [Oryza meyeriana var. granulata]